MYPAVAVVVPTKNSARTLKACLQSIRAQSVPVQCIVVDNFSTDDTQSIAKTYADVFIEQGPERSAQRNAGWKATQADFVFFIDSDMVLEPGVAQASFEAYEKSQAPVIVPEISVGTGYWARCKALERSYYENDSTIGAARFFPKALLEKIDGYDEALYAGEDWDISIRAERASRRAVFAEAHIIHDEGALHPFKLCAKKFYYGVGLVSFMRKHPRESRERLNPARGSLLRNLGHIVSTPSLAPGLFALKAGEALLGSLGILRAISAGLQDEGALFDKGYWFSGENQMGTRTEGHLQKIEKYASAHPHLFAPWAYPQFLGHALRKRTGGAYIDIGAGDGSKLVSLMRDGLLSSFEKIIATDLSELRIATLASHLPDVEVCIANAEALPFPSGSFDFVFSDQVIEHVPDDVKMAAEIYRILRPGGEAFVGSVIRLRGGWYFYRNNGRWCIDPTHLREYDSVDQFRDILRAANFSVKHIEAWRVDLPIADLFIKGLLHLRMVNREFALGMYANRRWALWARKACIRVPRYRIVGAIVAK